MQVLLDSHKEWYRRQRCRDPFEGLLGLDGLRKGPNLEHPFRRRVAGAGVEPLSVVMPIKWLLSCLPHYGGLYDILDGPAL